MEIFRTHKNGKTTYRNRRDGTSIIKTTYLSGGVLFSSYDAIGFRGQTKQGFANPKKAWQWAKSTIPSKRAPYAEPHSRFDTKF